MTYLVKSNQYRPMSIFDDFERTIDALFNGCSSDTCMPAVDVREEASRFVLEAEIPGVSEKDVEVKVEENLLTLSSVKTVNEEREAEGAGGFIIRERKRGGFSRSFVLPKEADKERISASYANGVLTLEIPKLPKEEPRSIQINSV